MKIIIVDLIIIVVVTFIEIIIVVLTFVIIMIQKVIILIQRTIYIKNVMKIVNFVMGKEMKQLIIVLNVNMAIHF